MLYSAIFLSILYIIAMLVILNHKAEKIRGFVKEKYPELYQKYFLSPFQNPFFYIPVFYPGVDELTKISEIKKMQINYTIEVYLWIFGLVFLIFFLSFLSVITDY